MLAPRRRNWRPVSIEAPAPIGGQNARPKVPFTRRFQRKTLIIAGSAFLVLLLLLIAGIVVVNVVQAENEAKAQAVDEYTTVAVSQEGAVSGLRAAINSSETALLTTGEEDVVDAALLETLSAEVGAAKSKLAAVDIERIDPQASSREDVIAATEQLKDSRVVAQDALSALSDARDKVKTSAAVQAARVAEEAARAAEDAARVAAEKKAAETAAAKAGAPAIAYEDLFRAGDSVTGTYYRFEGRIIQDAGSGTYRVNMTRDPGYSIVFWDDTILLTVIGTPSQRLLEDDIVSFTAASAGVQSYTTVFGASVTLPSVVAEGGDVAVTGRAD